MFSLLILVQRSVVSSSVPAAPSRERASSLSSQNELNGFDEPAGEGSVCLNGGLEAVPGGEDGGGAVIEAGAVDGGAFAEGGGVCCGGGAAAAVKAMDEDLEAWEVFGRAVVAQISDEPALGGLVIDGAEELAEALGTWVGVVEDVADRHARELGKLFELPGAKRRLIEVIADLDGKVTHGKILGAAKV